MAEAARLTPEIPLIVYSQTVNGLKSHRANEAPRWPKHVDVRGHQPTLRELYAVGDVCIQPSRWEGLGLQLLECQAAGMPLVTTHGEPMREHEPFRTIRATRSVHRVHRETTRYDAAPVDLARIMRDLHGQDVTNASRVADQFAHARSWANMAHVVDCLIRTETRVAEAG